MNSLIKVIVTGGAGYIGSHTVVDLFKNGYCPVIIDNFCNSSSRNIQGINDLIQSDVKIYEKDCTDYESISAIFKIEKNIVGCIHFAAFKSVEESVLNPNKYFKNNIDSLKVILRCMQENNIKNIIFSSSCTVYGKPAILPVTESSPFGVAESPYGETKQICERMLENDMCSSIALRYFNPIGSHSSSLIGDCSSDNASNLIPIVAEFASGVRDKLIINGIDYNTKDGTCVRDYIHVEDLASAHVNAFNYLLENNINHSVFNVGTGDGVSVLEIINKFKKVNKINIEYEIGPRRKGDIAEIYANDYYIKSKLKWSVKKTLADGLRSAWNWQLKLND